MSRVPGPRAPLFEALEERKLLSADAGLPTLDFAFAPAAATDVRVMDDAASPAATVQMAATPRRELVLVDANVPDLAGVLASLEAWRKAGRHLETVIVADDGDGLAQVSAALSARSNLDAVHLVSHGEPSAVRLGTTLLDLATLGARADEIRAWSRALAPGADLLVYGCDVAAGPDGGQWVARLHALTGADVAASTDPTGAADLGGDWTLEDRLGSIETDVLRAPLESLLAIDQLDWDTVRTAGSWPDSSYGPNVLTTDLGGKVTGRVTGDTAVLAQVSGSDPRLTPVVSTNVNGGTFENTLQLQSSGFAAGQSVTLTLDFSAFAFGVSNVSFSVFDIDTGGFIDRVTVGSDRGNPTAITTSVYNQQFGANAVVGNGAGNASNDAPDANAGFAFKWSTLNDISGIRTLTISYSNDGTVTTQGIGIHDVTFDATPGASNRSVAALEDQPYAFQVADFGFLDPGGDTLQSIRITQLPVAGALRLNGVGVTAGQDVAVADLIAGRLTFQAAPNANGSAYAAFRFRVGDGTSLSASDHAMRVDVTAVNDAPVGTSRTVTTPEDTPYVFAVADFGFSDPSDTPANALLAVRIATLPAVGTLRNNGVAVTTGQFVSAADIIAGRLAYTPVLNANGSPYASFTFQVQDNGGNANGGADLDPTPRTMTVNVTPVNDPPVAQNDAYATPEDTPLVVAVPGVLTNDSDIDSASISALLTSGPANGTLTLNANGSFTYTPNANWFGTDSFTYQASDGQLASSPATVSVTVAAVNDAPVASGSATLAPAAEDAPNPPGAAVAALFAANYSDALDGAAQTPLAGVAIVANAASAAQGTWQYAANVGGPWTNVPGAGLGDASAITLPGTALLRFLPAADFFGAPGPLTVRLADGSGPALSIASGVALTGAIGGTGRWSAGTVALGTTITAVNDPPLRTAGSVGPLTILEDAPATLLGLATIAYAPGPVNESPQQLTYTVTQVPAASLGNVLLADNVTVVGAGSSYTLTELRGMRFRPAPNANGGGTFAFTVTDDGNTNGSADPRSIAESLAITVTPVNDAPGLTLAGNVGVAEDAGAQTRPGFAVGSPGPADESGQTLAYTVTNDNAALFAVAPAIAPDGTLTFTPAANASGMATVSVLLRDSGGTTNGGVEASPVLTFALTVTPVNDPPAVTAPAGYSTAEQTTLVLSGTGITVADIDAGGAAETLTFNVTSGSLAAFAGTTGVLVAGSGTSSLTLTGTIAQLSDVLAGNFGASLAYFNASDTPPATATLSITLDDGGHTGAGGAQTATATSAIAIAAVNDPPVIAGLAPASYSENALPIALAPAATASDVDSATLGGGVLRVGLIGGGLAEDTLAILDQGSGAGQIGVAGSVISYAGVAIGSLSGGTAGADLVVAFNASATPAAAQALIRAVTYANSAENPSTVARTVRFTLVDGGGGNDTATADLPLAVLAVDDAPTIAGPTGPQSMPEDGALVFSAANGNALVVGDVDAAVLAITLTASHGTLTLAGTASLGFTLGTGSNDVAMTFTGTIAAINAALDGLRFVPAADFHGAVNLTVLADDRGATGVGGPLAASLIVPIAVTPVADTPSVTNAATLEDTQTASGLVVTPNAADGAEVTHFKVTAITGGLLFLADGTTPVTDGTFVTAAQGAAGLRFTPAPDAIAPGSFAVQASTSASDPGLGGGLAIASIAVTPVNDAPQLAIGPGQIVAEDSGPHVVPAFASASPGGGPDEASQTIGYVVANDNAALFAAAPALDAAGNLTFTSAPDAFGSATVTVRARDSGGTANGGQDTSAPRTFTITVTAVDDDPVAAADAATTDEDTPRSFPAMPGLLANDTDVDPGTSLVVHAVNGLTAAVGTPIVLASGARVQVNADGSWSYDPHGAFEYLAMGQTAADGFNYTVSDGAGGFSTAAVAVTVTGVNDAPVATADALLTNEDTVITGATPGVLGNDSDVDAGTTLLVAAVNGATTAVGNTVTLATGALLRVNADGRWRYDPNRAFESLGTGQSAIDGFTYIVADGAGGSATTTVTVTVQGVNDAPVNALPASPTVPEDTRVAIPGLSVSDPEGNVTRVTLSVAQGTLDVSLAGGAMIGSGANGSATLSIDGTLAQVNAALASLAYRPATNYTGTDALAITSFDADGASTASALAIAVAAVDDPPSLSAPAMRMTQEDVTLYFSAANGNPIVVADVDSPVLTVTLAASRGLLTLSTTAGLTFATGSGTNDATMVISGSAAAINAALDGLAFAPEPQFGGAAALAVSVSDGASAASAAVPIAVVPVADAPRLAAAPAIGDEDTRFPLALSAALVDRDGSEILSVTIDDVPVGVTLSDGVRSFTAAAGARRLDATGWNLAALTLASPQDSFGAFALAVFATSREAANGASATVSAALPVTVRPVNDAPVASGDAVLPAVVEDAPAPPGASAAALFAARYDDSRDASLATPLAGIAIVANAATAEQGVWQYSLDGATWKAVSSAGLGDANALTLLAGAMLRFLAAADWNGTPGALTVRLADGSRGAIGEQANVDLRGGTGAWSAASVMLRTAVTPENDAPVLVHRELTVAEGATRVIAPDALLATDADHAADQIFFTLRSLPAHGVLLFDGRTVDAGFRFTQADVAAGRLAYRHDGSETRSDAFAFDVADAAGAGLSGRTLAIDVTPVDDPPVIVAASIRGNGGEAGALQTVLRAADADTPASQLVFTVTDLRDGRFERIDRPGVAIVQFTQAEIDAGTVRFVSTNAFGVPSFTVWVSDDTSAVGPRTAAVTFAPALAWVPQRPVVEEPLPDVVSTAGPPPLGPYAGLVEPTMLAYLRPPSAPAPVGTMSVASADAVSRAAMRGAQKATPGDALADETRIAALPDAAIAFADPETIAIDHGKLAVDVISTRGVDLAGSSESWDLNLDSVRLTGMVFSVGFVWWALRASGLLASLLAAAPAWRHLDPLPVLGGDARRKGVEWVGARDAEAEREEEAVAPMLAAPEDDRA